ncbi:MAG: class I SAM-dependent methyltransferase [Gammaproteobacteria bacterium]|nr:class I SAM-dependent methyltransferase [Gammaproteobacteria bacterium]
MTPMDQKSHKQLEIAFKRDERAKANFVSALRRHVFEDLAESLHQHYNQRTKEQIKKALPTPQTARAVHQFLRNDEYFKFYSALRVSSQDLLYQTVRAPIERAQESLYNISKKLARRPNLGSLILHPELPIPRSVTDIDIHLMPGSYHSEYCTDDLTMGAVYENRLKISTFGLFGPNLDDIGQSMARFIRERFPYMLPKKILDLGCTVGHNTGAWKDIYPEAEVYGIDVAAPCLRYGAARARLQKRSLHFEQMNATALKFPSQSFDVVFSSMFLHEIPHKQIPKILFETHRILKPGGLMLHMELPSTSQLSAFDSFYLDWDSHYNNEPFYQAFRTINLRKLVVQAGFNAENYIQDVVPSFSALGDALWRAQLKSNRPINSSKTGRLSSGIQWFFFGAQK